MPYYGFSMETRGRWVKLPDGTFGVKTDGAAQRGMVIEVHAVETFKNVASRNKSASISGKPFQRKAQTVTTEWNAGIMGRKISPGSG